jgi:hypothetical protein
VEIAEDAMACSQDGGTVALHEEPERIAIAGKDGIDDGAFIGDLGAYGRSGDW